MLDVKKTLAKLLAHSKVIDARESITFNSEWVIMFKRFWIEGNMAHFNIEANKYTITGGTQYTIGNIPSKYRPKEYYAFTGHTTNGAYLGQGIVNCFVWPSGDITVRASNSNGQYVFIDGSYPIA